MRRSRFSLGDARVVPAGDLAEEDVGDDLGRQLQRVVSTPGRLAISTTEPITVGNCSRLPLGQLLAVSGASVAPKSTVRLRIWLMPPPEPMDW
jgi:hypothetical protein